MGIASGASTQIVPVPIGALNSPVSPVQFTSSVQLMEFPRAEFEYVAMLSPSVLQFVCVNICDILVNEDNL